jgi:hypothetical protein
VTTLERRYRRLIRILPKSYRAGRAEEILSTLLDDARPGQRRPGVRDAASLGSLAVRLRFGAPGAGPAGRLTGEIARMAIIANLILVSATSVSLPADFEGGRTPIDLSVSALSDVTAVGAAALFLALLFGRFRTARALVIVIPATSITQMFLAIHMARQLNLPFENWSAWIAVAHALLSSLTALAIFPAFHPETPRLSGTRWWILTWAALSLFATLIGQHNPPFITLVCLPVVAIALSRITVSPAYPIAFMIAGWPLVLNSVENLGTALPMGLPASQIAFTTAAAEGILLITGLASLAYRHRRRAA